MTRNEALVVMALQGISLEQALAWAGDDLDVNVNLMMPVPVGQATVKAQGVRVRESPSLGAKVLGAWTATDRYQVWGFSGDWVLMASHAMAGWCSRAYVRMA